MVHKIIKKVTSALRKCFIPTLAAVAVDVKTNDKPKEEEKLCRPSELPLYVPEPKVVLPPEEIDPKFSQLEDAVRFVRTQVVKFNTEFDSYKQVGSQEINRRKEDLEWLVDYLQEENNTLPKVGAIGIGALSGLIFGLRGGIIKKTLYAATGALGISSICYPKEASYYGQLGLTEGKKYVTVAYNFVTGGSKDAPHELPSLPPIPTSLNELWESVKSTTTSFISPKKPEVTEVNRNNEMNPQEIPKNLNYSAQDAAKKHSFGDEPLVQTLSYSDPNTPQIS